MSFHSAPFRPREYTRLSALIFLTGAARADGAADVGVAGSAEPGRAAEVVLLDEVDAIEGAVAVIAAGAGVGGRASRTSLSFMGEYSRPRDEPASALKLDAHPLVRDWLACVYV